MSQNTTPRAFSGVDRLYGTGAYNSLRKASITIVGIGGVGSWAAEAIARFDGNALRLFVGRTIRCARPDGNPVVLCVILRG